MNELFSAQNDDWKLEETSAGAFQLSTKDNTMTAGPMSTDKLRTLNAVIAEFERYLQSQGA